MNTKRNLWRKKEDRCRVCKWRHMELLSTRRAWHTTCQWSDPSQHVTSLWHAASHWSIRSNTALWLVSLRVPGILSITASPLMASRRRIKTLISKLDLVIERSLTAKVDSRCFHLEKVALRKRERLTAVFCPSSKYWGVVPFTRGWSEPGAPCWREPEVVKCEIYCESSRDNKIIWSDVSCTWPSEQIFNLGCVTTCQNTEIWRRAQATMFI